MPCLQGTVGVLLGQTIRVKHWQLYHCQISKNY
uniref:Uncharacterized protein n=1 Tax=Anguilla anguilla TaxID=7936 RepID=A0A0E9S091_ANGAN